MILQALMEYYDRKAADPASGIAPPGWEWKEIPFVIVLKPDGTPNGIECTYEGKGSNRRAKRYLVPQTVKRASGIAANLLWDTPEYALGVVQPGKKRSANKNEAQIRQRVAEQHAAFKERIVALGVNADTGLGAVRAFLGGKDLATALAPFGEPWTDLLAEGANVSFKLAGAKNLVSDAPTVKNALATRDLDASREKRICLVTGEEDTVERLHAAIKGVWGAQSSGANIVSFNLDSFRSYGKEQGANAPIGKKAADAYTKALNDLLSKDSLQRMQVGDSSTVFWSAKETAFEQQVVEFFSEPPKDDPDRNTRAVESLFNAPKTGALPSEKDETTFYVLGLAPNASRIAIRFWIVGTVAEMSAKIRQYFEDTRITHGPRDRDVLPLFRLLVSTAALGKADNVQPNLTGDTMRAILEGLPYPATLLTAAVRRNRAEQAVTYPRAALIKACLNRSSIHTTTKERKLTMSLDLTNTNVGYRLGRLFAVLERLQTEASPGINATIRDRYYGAASGTPVSVFPILMRLKNHHLAKLENVGRRVNLEKLIGEIVDGVTDFPTNLPMTDQGRFAIGYYHQMQAFFKKTDHADRSNPSDSTNLA